MDNPVIHVDVTVDPEAGIVCSPDPVPVSTRNALVTFNLKSEGYRFRDRDAIVVANPKRDFPYPSWTVGPDRATLLDLDSSRASYKYSVFVVDQRTGEELSVDPTIENEPQPPSAAC